MGESASFYEWIERYLNSENSRDEVDIVSIDESIEPTWTGTHEFDGGLTFGTLFLDNDPTAQVHTNAGVTSIPAAGDEQSYVFQLNSENVLKVYAEADGSGGIQNKEVRIDGDVKTSGELTEGSAL